MKLISLEVLFIFNRVTFEPVMTTKLRIEIRARQGFSVGILEWRYGE